MEPLDESDELTGRARARIGSRLLDKWLLEELIGVGGMAAVYAASHRNGKRVAIKILHRDGALNDESRARFLREGLVANTVGHKGAVSVLDEDVTEDGAPFFVMDLFEGETLDNRLRRKGPLDVDEVLSAAYHLLDVLAAAHDKRIIHRDIKPENVFLTKDASVKVLDFGIAQLRQTNSTSTKVGHTMGTPSFMAPEQARGRWDEVDQRSDLWSVGATMFTLLTGRHVHEAETLNEVLLGAMTAGAEPVARHRRDLPPEVCGLVDKALAFAPADRWQTAREMQEAVNACYNALRQPADWARAPTLIAPSVSTPHVAPTSQAATPPTATTSRPTARTSSVHEAPPPKRGVARRTLAIVGAVGALAVASWVAVGATGMRKRPRPAEAANAVAGGAIVAVPVAATSRPSQTLALDPPPPPAVEETANELSGASASASATAPHTTASPAPVASQMHPHPRHAAPAAPAPAATPAAAATSAPASAAPTANPLDRRH